MDKRIEDLDDVDKLLRERPRNRVITKRRNRERYRARQARALRELRIERGIVTIPALIIALICIVLILEPFFGEKENMPQAASPSEISESRESTETAEETGGSVQPLSDETLKNFFTRYFEAKLAADVDTLDSMSGISNRSEEQRRQLAAQLKAQAGYIEAYQDLNLYGVPGLGENELLVFLSYDVKFRRAETVAPAIMYCYMMRLPDGGYQLIENRSPEQVRFVNSYTTEHGEVQELINSVNSRLLAALSSDSRLAVIYDAFQTGRIYTEDQASIDSEVSLISVETEAESSTESSTGSSSAAETRRETTRAAGTTAAASAQQSEHVVEAVDPMQQSTESAAAAEGGAVAPAGDVIEAAGGPQ
ncbi:hypothetical protein HW273_08800 [Oribacterium sp. oral taxon 102]|uniref:hypothetical protein n=1 Tax=Oribacterium sp. oral taxon 102 TaxID=671214 RepID=UPI0015B8A3CA|nr:hypothetical protein [Oribacterium sp. oral taxon 102]NWO21996.1 hypothetical protein [Oribacterium sp. oral taxon 102]